jgi:hypothetical protein
VVQEKKVSKAEEEVRPVKEVPIPDQEIKHNNESGCVLS